MIQRRSNCTSLATALAAVCGFAVCSSSRVHAQDIATKLNQQLAAANLAGAAKDLEAVFASDPTNDQARFGLGAVQFLQTVERLGQALYRFGVGNDFPRSLRNTVPGGIPFLHIPVPSNPKPEKVTKAAVRQTLQRVISDLAKVEGTLGKIKSESVKLPLQFGMIRLDLNGDGKSDASESLWRIFAAMNRDMRIDEKDASEFVIAFDRGDVDWLRGYCHLLSALAEVILAHDASELFEVAAPLFFPVVDSPYNFLNIRGGQPYMDEIADAIAILHNFRARVREPQRLRAALDHLRAMFALSRSSWKYIQNETDDDHEWLPNPKQTGVIPRVRISGEMISAWLALVDEADEILAGRKLVPHWRVRDGRGINLNKVFTQPRSFDLVMWIHGMGAAPFLENGPMTSQQTWMQLERVFQGQFIGFAFWFN